MPVNSWAVKLVATAIFISSVSIAQDIQFHQDSPTEISFSINPKFRLYNFDVEYPAYVLGPEKARIKLKALTPTGEFDEAANGEVQVKVGENIRNAAFVNGYSSLEVFVDSSDPIVISSTDTEAKKTIVIKMISRYILLAGLALVAGTVATLVLRKGKKNAPQQTVKAS